MKTKLSKIIAYIFRGWEDEPKYTHPLLKLFAPFILELIAYLIGLSILYQISLNLFKLI
jgi:hypothetical protein